MRIRSRFPRLLRLLCALLALMLLITVGWLYGIRAAQPAPLCLLYRMSSGPTQIDVRSGQMALDRRGYYTTFYYSRYGADLSPDGRAFMMISTSGYGGPDVLYSGVPSDERIHKIANQYYISGEWSPDSSAYAYVYQGDEDQFTHITIINPAGRLQRTQPLFTITFDGIPHFAGWSADGKYLAVMDSSTGKHYFAAAETLQALPTMLTAYLEDYAQINALAWSPQGNRYAYVDMSTDPLSLVIATVEHGVEQRLVLNAPDDWWIGLPLVWSPDGRYLTLRRKTVDRQLHDNEGIWWESWTYSIFGVDGSAHIGIAGQKLTSASGALPDGWWSSDSTRWIFRQQLRNRGIEETDTDIFSTITAYQVESSTSQPLIEHVAGAPLLLGEEWIAVPVWNRNMLDVKLVSIDGKAQKSLLTDATMKPLPRVEWSADANGGTIAAIWTRLINTGQYITAITWANADGSEQHVIDEHFEEIFDFHWLNDQRSIYFVAQRNGAYMVRIVDLETGKTVLAINDLPVEFIAKPAAAWSDNRHLFSSPSGRQLVLKFGPRDNERMYVVALDTKRIRQFRKEGTPTGAILWSPDETLMAFKQFDFAKGIDTLQIVAADGTTLRTIDLPSEESPYLSGWTWCQGS